MAIRYRREGLRIIREGEGAPGAAAETVEVAPPVSAAVAAAPPLAGFRQRVLDDVARRRRLGLVADRADWRTPKTPHGITGEQLAQARRVLGLSQRQLADRMLCSRSAIAEAERGRRPVLPNVAAWVGQTLRVSGDLPEAEAR